MTIELKIYLIFVVSWFLHMGSRVQLLGLIRFDLILIIILFILIILTKKDNIEYETQTDRLLKFLIIYSVLTIPFVEWPGSVIRIGIQEWIKAAVFYYFTIAFVKTESDLKIFIFVFLACQSWRILEPLYLHITEGYWGTVAYMSAGTEALDRLSGAPSDIVNPNGLAFIICTILPFLYFMAGLSWKNRLAFFSLAPAFVYALVLTGSRSGIIGLFIIFLGILIKSKRRLIIGFAGIFIALVSFSYMAPDMQDRYLSIFGEGEKNQATAEGRYEGVMDIFNLVVLRRPLFGYGLGTSREANANFAGIDQPAHNLYVEVASELGLIGMIVFILFIKSIVINFSQINRMYSRQEARGFLFKLNDAMQVWLAMNIVFSFASYGLSSYEWYLFAAFSRVILRLTEEKIGNTASI